MTKMEKLAAIFGKKPNEEFIIRFSNNTTYKGSFTEDWLYVEGMMPSDCSLMLYLLFKGEATILEEC